MKLIELTYFNKALGWKIEKIEFDDLNLLIGVSGVGKSQILKAILDLQKIARGESINGIYWKVIFKTINGLHYQWEGEFENRGFLQELYTVANQDEVYRSKIVFEKLTLNNQLVAERNEEGLYFKGIKTIKLSSHRSIVQLLKEEEEVTAANQGFKKILDSNKTQSQLEPRNIRTFPAKSLAEHYTNLPDIRLSNESPIVKLFLIYRNVPECFNEIKEKFILIFPQVTDLKFELIESKEEIPAIFKEQPIIQLKESGVRNWIHQGRFSSGMFRTLIHITELYLCAEGSLILMDEFENSLGSNCMDFVTEDLLESTRNIQFILTSHHPYVINNIDFNYWKIVTRKGGKIRTIGADEYDFGDSRHDAYILLNNLDEYISGVEF